MLMMTFSSLAQQTTVEGSKFFENTYMGVSVGGQTNMTDLTGHQNWTVAPTGSLYFGKWLTPTFGLELNGDVLFHDGFSSRNKFVDGTYVGIAGRFNLNNAFHAYRGRPDAVEVIPFVGIGWLHGYGNGEFSGEHGNLPTRYVVGKNALATKMGIDLSINLDKNYAWSLNVRPTVEYALASRKIGYPHYDKNYGRVGLEVGFTYKFGYKNSIGQRTHNFTPAYTVAQYDAMVDELSNREPEVVYVVQETVKEIVKEIPVVEKMPVYILTQPYFNCASYELGPTADVVVDIIANEMNSNSCPYTITGYASLEGAEQFNVELSKQRAQSVYDVLVEAGINPDRLTVVAGGPTDKFGDSYEMNRTVVIEHTNCNE